MEQYSGLKSGWGLINAFTILGDSLVLTVADTGGG
jgi:hypothetical protein